LLAFAVGLVARRPLAGFVSAAAILFATTYGMAPKDGIGFNGEVVAMPFVLLATVLTIVALRSLRPTSESRVWLAAIAGFALSIGALCKQVAALHALPIAMWWLAVALRERDSKDKLDLRPMGALIVGVLTPLVAVTVFFARAGHLRDALYYFFTYNKTIYLGPITAGYAIESSYLFWREHGELLLLSTLGVGWAIGRVVSVARSWSWRDVAAAFDTTALTSVTALQLLAALFGAVGTFRFWDHYFITTLPWFGLLAGILVEDNLENRQGPGLQARTRWAHATIVGIVVLLSFAQRHLTTLWLDGERRSSFYLDPHDEPITNYIVQHTAPNQTVFVWGFAAEFYVSSRRLPASRFVFATFPSGMIPWFHWLTLQQEDSYAVPGARDLLIQELEHAKPPLIVDVPVSMRGRSMRRYQQLADYVDRNYCYDSSVVGRNGRTAYMYQRRNDDRPCGKAPPPLPKPE
jgi:general stress protein CsbA